MTKYKAQSFVCDIYLDETLRQTNVFAEHVKGSQYIILGYQVTLLPTNQKGVFQFKFYTKTGLHLYKIIKKDTPMCQGAQYDN